MLVPSAVADNKDARLLLDAIYQGRPGTIDKRIQGIFTGKFEWHRGKMPARVLSLQSVVEIQVKVLSK